MRKFSSGDVYVVGLVANDTPIKIGHIQGVELNFDQEIVRLMGADTFPVDLANGAATLAGSYDSGEIQADVVTKILAGSSVASGYKKLHRVDSATIPATPGPYTITSAQSAGFQRDLGVRFTATNLPLTKVASGPTTGQYSVSAGVYTFAAADQALGVAYAHTYSVAGSGQTVTIANAAMGATTKYLLGLYNSTDGFGIELLSVVMPKIGFSIKTGQWVLPKGEFEACANSSGNVASIYIP